MANLPDEAAPCILATMIHTEIVVKTIPRIVQRISGTTTYTEVQQGIFTALHIIDQALVQSSNFDLVLDLRDLHFADVQAHKVWRTGFLAHPTIVQHARRTAIIGHDAPSFHAEKQLLETTTCRFFLDLSIAHAWLETDQPT